MNRIKKIKPAKTKFIVSKLNRGAKIAIVGVFTCIAFSKFSFSKQPYQLEDKPERRIIVVGAGLTGLTTAYYLTKDARNLVTLIEKD